MRILYVTATFPPKSYGGVTTVSYNMARTMSRAGHEVTVFTTDLEDRGSRISKGMDMGHAEGISVRYFANVSNRLANERLFLPVGMISAIRKRISQFDIVHLHDYRSFPTIIVHHYARGKPVPYVLQAHGSITTYFGKGALKNAYDRLWGLEILRDAKRLIATTPAEAEQYSRMGAPKERVTVIPNGIDSLEFANLPAPGMMKGKLGIPTNRRIILSLGRIHRIKGTDLLVQAFARIARILPDVDLVIAGFDDGYLPTVMKVVRAMGIKSRVWFTGAIAGKDRLAAYVDADVFVLPSRYEIFGLVAFEAIMCGTPIVVSASCGMAPFIRSADMGCVAKADDTVDLARNLQHSLANPLEAKRQVERGKAFVERNLSWQEIKARLEIVYEECISRR